MSSPIQNVFVLMLENRSFDHMLGFSGIAGTDAATGLPTRLNGLTGAESNSNGGATIAVTQPAPFTMPADPAHEFPDVLIQLCGAGAVYQAGAAYPAIHNSGFVASYAAVPNAGDPADIMRCFSPGQLPVLNALAKEFVVCDSWFASLPGPTWPNRFFVHAGSSGGLDHSPTTAEIVLWETLAGFRFSAGTIFDSMNRQKVAWRIYAGDDFPVVAALKGIQLDLIHPFHEFAADVGAASYDVAYTFIEPGYDVQADYKCGTSQHPLGDVTRGEALIKSTYEAIRNSPLWPRSLMVITWDEHGGFYDHVAPPPAVAPGDSQPDSEHNQNGFTFAQYGVRVPAVAISPWIPRNLVDHRVYDHTSILATLEGIFNLPPLTQRDARANRLMPLVTLASPRTDAPTTLPAPANSGITACPPVDLTAAPVVSALVARPGDPIDGNLAGILHSALRADLELSRTDDRSKILARFSGLKTRADAMAYAGSVRAKLRAAKSKD